MEKKKFAGFDCIEINNERLAMLVTVDAGPRVISLTMDQGENLFALLPDAKETLPDGREYLFRGGHRLWHSPEAMPRTYVPDDDPVDVSESSSGLTFTQKVEEITGLEKSIRISISDDKPQVILNHTLTNLGLWPVECAPWAITQMRSGGTAILPQNEYNTGYLPNRAIALWPYAKINNPQVQWGDEFIFITAKMDAPFKIGFPNPRGWLAYWLDGTLFMKQAAFDEKAEYFDFNSSSECYCNGRFLELETLGPITNLEPGESTTHTEIWNVYTDVDFPADEAKAGEIIRKAGLE